MSKKKEKLTLAERNLWGKFARDTVKFDKRHKLVVGSHWLDSLPLLLGENSRKIKKSIPDKHPLKLGGRSIEDLNPQIIKLQQILKKIYKIDFSEINFKKQVEFSNFIFPIETDFSNTTFSKDVLFTDTVFLEAVDFKKAQFNGERAKFKNTTFKKIADFSDTIFQHYANFKGSVFNGRTTFQRAKFKLHALRFYGVDLNNEIIWTGIKRPTLWKKEDDRIDKSGEWLSYQDGHAKYRKRVGENQNAYETLAYLMDKQEKYHDQHFFFRQEMRCRRNLEWFFIKPFYWFYQIVANYGYGIGNAFCFWLLHICAWTGILYCFAFQGKCGIYQRLSCSFFTSLSNAHSFFLSKSERLTSCTKIIKDKPLFDFIWAMETISGALFLFLVLLTLRVRFRIK